MQKLSEELKQAAKPIVADIQKHPFVQGIQHGFVPKAALLVYVEQDTCFLAAFAKVYAGALMKCETKDQMRFFEAQIKYSLEDETTAHAMLCEIAGATLADHQHAEERPATYLYNAHLYDALRTGDLIDLIAAVLPCPWTYNEISQELLRQIQPDNPFLPWLNWYEPSADGEDPMVNQLFEMLDELAVELTPKRRQQVRQRFIRSCELEYDFWEQAYNQQDWKYRHLEC